MSSLSSYHIRSALPEDCYELAHVHILSWYQSYAELLSAEELAKLTYKKRLSLHQQILERGQGVYKVAQVEDQIVGFMIAGPASDKDKSLGLLGEVYTLYVLKYYQRKGIGKALLQAAQEWFKESSLWPAVIWTGQQNQPAALFYESQGGVLLPTRRHIENLLGPARPAYPALGYVFSN